MKQRIANHWTNHVPIDTLQRLSVPVLCLGMFFCAAGTATAATTILESDFDGPSPGTATPWTQTRVLDPDLEFSGWARGSGVYGSATLSNAFGFYVSAGEVESTLADAITEEEHVGCTVGPRAGASLDFSGLQINFSIQRIDWHAPRQYAVLTSIGGFTETNVLFVTTRVNSGGFTRADWSFFLPATGYESLTDPLEIRIYGYAANWHGHETSLAAFSLVEAIQTCSMHLTAESGGTVRSDPSKTVFAEGETVQLYAEPESGYRFAGWAGDVTGWGNPRFVRMDASKVIQAQFEPLPAPFMTVGSNLDGVTDWTTAWPFVDLQKRMRTWRTRNVDGSGGWDSGQSALVPTDTEGWPTEVPFDPGNGGPRQYVHTILTRVNEPGEHVFFYEGSGDLRFGHTGRSTQALPTGGARTHTFNIPSRDGMVWIEIRATDPPPNHLRHFRIVQTNHVDTHLTQPFHPLFLERLAAFDNLRFMDWARINSQSLQHWRERTRTNHYTQARSQGVALEFMVQLCNTLQKDMWPCDPCRSGGCSGTPLGRPPPIVSCA